ncbi:MULTISPECIES: hypothetical protein [unclassified Herbaspirillum]|uniref:hypothetical protein n=1 Tax=unclassified Herbaspirillum TaxID=2624150 RepID=UPI0016227E71|nr:MULTISPECIES: hypothetical protein [unclassified Herbaspirillum]
MQTYPLARSLVEANIGIAVVDNFTANAGNTGNADKQIQIRRMDLPAVSKIYAVTNRARPAPKSAEFLLEAIRRLPA